jgi:hypothetical protein
MLVLIVHCKVFFWQGLIIIKRDLLKCLGDGKQKFQQNIVPIIFKRITSEERKVALQHEVKLLNVNAHVPNKVILKQVEKCVMGRS